MINTIENTITEHLKDVFKEFQVDSFPVDFQKFGFLSPKGCILVRFENSTVSTQTTMTAVNAEETYHFTIFAAMRYAQKHSDTYSFLQDIKRTLNLREKGFIKTIKKDNKSITICENIPVEYLEVVKTTFNQTNSRFKRMMKAVNCIKAWRLNMMRFGVNFNIGWLFPKPMFDLSKLYKETI